ncbi:hypothetical protein Peur_069054 [Populus x canadensis]
MVNLPANHDHLMKFAVIFKIDFKTEGEGDFLNHSCHGQVKVCFVGFLCADDTTFLILPLKLSSYILKRRGISIRFQKPGNSSRLKAADTQA